MQGRGKTRYVLSDHKNAPLNGSPSNLEHQIIFWVVSICDAINFFSILASNNDDACLIVQKVVYPPSKYLRCKAFYTNQD